ncbi:MAG: hypothetical protein LUF32_06360 [Clostridiales bacterium]|nr:hypothetical protein [Clostridiales bacterium]
MNTTKKTVTEILFDSYVAGNMALNTAQDEDREGLYIELFNAMQEAGLDTEVLIDLNHVTMEAAFYAGIRAAKSLLSM